eukprot:6775774-Pyramimonas_sp.AAC.1
MVDNSTCYTMMYYGVFDLKYYARCSCGPRAGAPPSSSPSPSSFPPAVLARMCFAALNARLIQAPCATNGTLGTARGRARGGNVCASRRSTSRRSTS